MRRFNRSRTRAGSSFRARGVRVTYCLGPGTRASHWLRKTRTAEEQRELEMKLFEEKTGPPERRQIEIEARIKALEEPIG